MKGRMFFLFDWIGKILYGSDYESMKTNDPKQDVENSKLRPCLTRPFLFDKCIR